jgi:cellobionic acid phosphorylase
VSERLVTTGERCELASPTAMPHASAFLWNPRLLLQVNCRGFVTAQHLQPGPAKYAHAPNLEARTFMQPEQPYYAHHPGRFVYLRDEDDGALFSAPYEPVRQAPETFRFSAGAADARWDLEHAGIRLRWQVELPPTDAVELWTLAVENTDTRARRWSVFPYFTIGFMSWMNQSAAYRHELGGIVARSVTPYQKLKDYEHVLTLKDRTYLLHDTEPKSWETVQSAFEGEGGLHDPAALRNPELGCGEAAYETPVAVLHYPLTLAPGEQRRFRFLFGPARDDREIDALRERHLVPNGFRAARTGYREFLEGGFGALEIRTPDEHFDAFVNHWLPRQIHCHGSGHRFTTDPQTRNYLQDAMGMCYLRPAACRDALLTVLTQQAADGALPDGIRLVPEAELQYINQVPHSDHCAWLPLTLAAYLDESGDYALLDEAVDGQSVFERVDHAMDFLVANLDGRDLSLIAQGDWCDPMNRVGHGGTGVSGWLSIATVHALQTWATVCDAAGRPRQAHRAREAAAPVVRAVQDRLWDGDRFARGITDAGRVFGLRADAEGRLFLNPQSWAVLADIATPKQVRAIIKAVESELETPWGPQMLAPAYTGLVDDIGRLTQKFPGSAENGSIYNHAAAFWAAALFRCGDPDRAFSVLRRMIPGPDEADLRQRGQLPVFIPNYYRGAVGLHPRTAGRSSQLLHTGTVAWYYRSLIEDLFGLRGGRDGLFVRPALPSAWSEARAVRRFRGARFRVDYRRDAVDQMNVVVNGRRLDEPLIRGIEAGKDYEVVVTLPAADAP